jgi:putative sugar O-methyltransferase
MSLETLHDAYARCTVFADRIVARGDLGTHVSEFWAEILGGDRRSNYPTFDEMLVMRRGFTYPIADRGKSEDREADRAYAEAAWQVVGQTVDRVYFDGWRESAVGAPFSYSFDGLRLSPGGIVNALTSARIVELCRESGLASRPLRVLEIGAGYGQVAHQLLQQLDIKTYAVCDLPENAFLGAFYLQANWPARSVSLISREGEPADAGLVYTVPPLLAELRGPWDLVINSYSFQEMTRESVELYLAHASTTLAEDGYLYSLNAHGKGGTGIERPSDYAAPGLSIATIAPVRRFPWQMFATVPYELVMRRGPEAGPDAETVRQLDGIGRAMQFGLHDELVDACASFGHARQQSDTLDALAAFGDNSLPAGDRDAAAKRLGGALGAYLQATLAFATDADDAEDTLRHAVSVLRGTHAEVRARVALASFGGRSVEDADLARAIALAPHLEREIQSYAVERLTLRALLASQLGLGAEPPRRPPPRSRFEALGRWLGGERQSR